MGQHSAVFHLPTNAAPERLRHDATREGSRFDYDRFRCSGGSLHDGADDKEPVYKGGRSSETRQMWSAK